MTATQWLAIAVPCITALLVSYWHRKQVRQVELYKRDPSVGLEPPPSVPYKIAVTAGKFAWKAVARYGFLFVGCVLPLGFAVFEILRTRKLSPASALNVAMGSSNLLCYTVSRVLDLIGKLTDIDNTQSGAIGHINTSVSALHERLKAVEALHQPNAAAGGG
jgi:hypothetical protein